VNTKEEPKSPTNSLGQQDPAPEADVRPTKIGAYEVHPLANWFPMIIGNQFKDFLKDIEQHGQQSPVVLFENKILEGRNRALAVHQLGRELKTVEFDELGTNQSPLEYVISYNLHRRHLTDDQRVQIAAQLAKLLAEENARESGTQVPLYKNQNETGRGKRSPASIAAAQMGVSRQAVNRALAREEAANRRYREKIAKICGQDVIQKLDQGKILTEPGDLERFAKLPPDRMKVLKPFILKSATFSKAYELEDNHDLRLRDRLKKLFGQGLEKEIHGPLQLVENQVDDYVDAFQKAVGVATHEEVLSLAGIEPGADPDKIDPQKIDEMILRCHQLNKERPSNQEAEISLHDILGRSTSQSSESDKDSEPLRSDEELQAIDRIAKLCRGNNPEEIENWHKLISDKVKFEDIMDWDHHNDEEVCKIGRLMHGNMGTGLRAAIRIVDRVIDSKTRLEDLHSLCIAEGGRWEHDDGAFRIVIDRGPAFDREQVNRQLCDAVEGTAEHEPIKEALEQSKWNLTDGQLAGLASLGVPLLQKILPCLLYGSGPNNAELDIPFEESAI
jgi:hypothetical protein